MCDSLQRTIDSDQVPRIVDAVDALDAEAAGKSIQSLMELSTHRAFPVRAAVARKLGETLSERVLPILLDLTREDYEGDRHVRRAAVNALERYRGSQVEEALEAATYDSALNVRADAEMVLAIVRRDQ